MNTDLPVSTPTCKELFPLQPVKNLGTVILKIRKKKNSEQVENQQLLSQQENWSYSESSHTAPHKVKKHGDCRES